VFACLRVPRAGTCQACFKDGSSICFEVFGAIGIQYIPSSSSSSIIVVVVVIPGVALEERLLFSLSLRSL
jgi:hypothetical protein